MKKSVIAILILLSIVILMIGLKLSKQNIAKDKIITNNPGATKGQGLTQDMSNWILVKSIPLAELYGDPWDYKLITKTNPDRLFLKEKKGKVLWTKTNLERYSNMIILEDTDILDSSDTPEDEVTDDSDENDSDEDFPYDGEFPDNRIASWGAEFIDGKGNCLLTDKKTDSFVLVDKSGKEKLLPITKDIWGFYGMALDKYLVFSHSEENGLNPQWIIFNKQGQKLKQFNFPDLFDVWEGQINIDENANYLAYNLATEPEGYAIRSTTGKLVNKGVKATSGFWVLEPAFSQGGDLWIPETQDADDIRVLEIKTGKLIYTLKDSYGCQAAISDRAAGCMIITNGKGVMVLDYISNKAIFKQDNANAEFREPWISGDGKEIRFVYQEKGKHSVMRYYRMT